MIRPKRSLTFFVVFLTYDPDVIVLSGLLQGDYTIVELVEKIKAQCFAARIIVIVDYIKEEERNNDVTYISLSKANLETLKKELY